MALPHHHHLQKPEEPPPPPNVRPPFDPHSHNQPPPPPHVIRPIFDHHQPAPPPPHVILSLDPYPHPRPPPTPPPVFDHLHPPGDPGHPPPPPRADHKPTVRLYTKAETHFSLTIRHGKVVLAPSNPADPFQHWFKEEKYSRLVKDEEGFPSFALVNKATDQAIKHSIGATHPVQLIPYNPDRVDESVLWTLSKDLGDGYRTIRMVNNIRLNMDAFNGDANHGGVRDGTIVVLWEWKKGPNQRWNIISYCELIPPSY